MKIFSKNIADVAYIQERVFYIQGTFSFNFDELSVASGLIVKTSIFLNMRGTKLKSDEIEERG